MHSFERTYEKNYAIVWQIHTKLQQQITQNLYSNSRLSNILSFEIDLH